MRWLVICAALLAAGCAAPKQQSAYEYLGQPDPATAGAELVVVVTHDGEAPSRCGTIALDFDLGEYYTFQVRRTGFHRTIRDQSFPAWFTFTDSAGRPLEPVVFDRQLARYVFALPADGVIHAVLDFNEYDRLRAYAWEYRASRLGPAVELTAGVDDSLVRRRPARAMLGMLAVNGRQEVSFFTQLFCP